MSLLLEMKSVLTDERAAPDDAQRKNGGSGPPFTSH
jgi:hypothetical protein